MGLYVMELLHRVSDLGGTGVLRMRASEPSWLLVLWNTVRIYGWRAVQRRRRRALAAAVTMCVVVGAAELTHAVRSDAASVSAGAVDRVVLRAAAAAPPTVPLWTSERMVSSIPVRERVTTIRRPARYRPVPTRRARSPLVVVRVGPCVGDGLGGAGFPVGSPRARRCLPTGAGLAPMAFVVARHAGPVAAQRWGAPAAPWVYR
jgi:hypothetical protein